MASGSPVRAAPAPASMAGTTRQTLGLLRELRRRPARRQAASIAYWLYLAGLVIISYGGWLITAMARALRHPPPPGAATAMLGRAAPAGLCALALGVLAALLWDARWRGPVSVTGPTADWLLDTPVDRGKLVRPRYRAAVVTSALAGAAAGLVPAVLLLAAGLGSGGLRHSLALTGASMLSTALLAALGTGAAAWSQAKLTARGRQAAARAAGAAAAGLAVIAVLTAVLRLPDAVAAVLLWSGPWGWAAQAPVAFSGGNAPLWPAATAVLAAAAAGLAGAADRAAAGVPAATLRLRAHTIGRMSAAALNFDTRRITTAYRGVTGAYRRPRLRVRLPRHRRLVLPARDLLALARIPARTAWSALLALAAVGLCALGVRSPHAALPALAAGLSCGYLAAAGLCEGARLDSDDPRRSGSLPFRYQDLAWWHAVTPSLALAVLAGIPAAIITALAGRGALILLVAATIPVLTGGALVNSFRGQVDGGMFGGFDTPAGHTAGIMIVFWFLTGPLLAVGPMIILWYQAVTSGRASHVILLAVLASGLAAWLGSIAARRARRLHAP